MKAYYKRISDERTQKLDRQNLKDKDYDIVVTDKCSGSVPFFEREGGKKLLELVKKGHVTSIHTSQVDRFGRSLLDIITSVNVFKELDVNICFIEQGIQTKDKNGKENYIANLLLATLSTVAELENSIRKERIKSGVVARKKRLGEKAYPGRKPNTKEDTFKFLSKTKNKKAYELLKKGYKCYEVQKIVGLSHTTIAKIRRRSGLLNFDQSHNGLTELDQR